MANAHKLDHVYFYQVIFLRNCAVYYAPLTRGPICVSSEPHAELLVWGARRLLPRGGTARARAPRARPVRE